MAQVSVTRTESTLTGTWIERIARLGYAVKGLTYFLIGVLALQSAFGAGKAENTRGALRSVEGAAIGNILLIAIAVGLAAYALWKLYYAAFNPERAEPRKRVAAAFVGLVNVGFALEAVRLAVTAASAGPRRDEAAHWSGILMGQPVGVLAVGAIGAGVAAYGIMRIVKAIRAKLDDQLRLQELKPRTRRAVVTASRLGISARGVVFVLVGIFLVRAALRANPAEAKDFGHSLQELKQQPYGLWLLAAVAVGLFLYGIYELVRAKYRKFET